jgi:transposase
MGDLFTMSNGELTRADLMQRLVDNRLKQAEVAALLNLSVRQVKRLLRAYRQGGAGALVSKRRGKASNHQLPQETKDQALKLIKTRYSDFGPTLAREKLLDLHDIKLSVESVRTLMICAELWRPKRGTRPSIHQMRERRCCLGELVQLDGSPHDWFEGRGPRCTLLVFIDDATGRLMQLLFAEAESTHSYFEALGQYVRLHGKPKALYSDKFSVFRPTRAEALGGEGVTQFGRAMRELDIEIICANTPQAKGRVERANQTLQDRLVKEMRLRSISSIEQANNYAPDFIKAFNERFARVAKSPGDAHRQVVASEKLERILQVKERRILSKNLTLSFNRVIYQIKSKRASYTMRKAEVWVCESRNGEITIEYKGKALDYTTYHKQPRQAEVVDSKRVEAKGFEPISNIKRHKPGPDHPWKRLILTGRNGPGQQQQK